MEIEATQLRVEVSDNYWGSPVAEGGEGQIFFRVCGKEASFCDGEQVFGAITAEEARDIAHALSELANWAESGGFGGDIPR